MAWVWIVVTAENGWQRLVTRNGRTSERWCEKKDEREGEKEREREVGRGEEEERKNGPVPRFGLETLITQDHRLWQSNLLGCCLKNNHKHPAAIHTNTHKRKQREMGIKWNVEKWGAKRKRKSGRQWKWKKDMDICRKGWSERRAEL